MNRSAPHIKHLLQKKLVTVLLVTASVACFATLGDGGKKGARPKGLLTNLAGHYSAKNFSLKSTFPYRGSQLLSMEQPKNYIMLNTVVTYQKGNAIYTLPMKKKVLLDKVTFNPANR